MKIWVTADEDGRIVSAVTMEKCAVGMTEAELPDEVTIENLGDYRFIDGAFSYTGEATAAREEAEKARQREALKASQLETVTAMYVKVASLPRVQAISVCTLYDEWSGAGVKYTKGQWLRYGDDFAYVEQDHTSQPDWTPEVAPSLYTLFMLAPDGVRIWQQPTRAEDAFDETEKCHYPDAAGQIYESKINGNTTVPGSDERYWKLA